MSEVVGRERGRVPGHPEILGERNQQGLAELLDRRPELQDMPCIGTWMIDRAKEEA